jgi:nucleoside-diphosphate-sugar epimerase
LTLYGPRMFIIYGATGFIGRAIQAALIARGAPYVGIGTSTFIRNDVGPVAVVEAKTLADRASLLQRTSAPKAVIFAAGPALATTDPEALRAAHLGSLRGVFEILPRGWYAGLSFVYTSSGLVYGRRRSPQPIRECDPAVPNSAYGEIKLSCEELLAEWTARTGARAVAARLFNVTGPGQANSIVVDVARQADSIRRGARSEFRLRSSTPILDLIDVGEAAEGLVRLAEASAPPSVVNVCSGRPLTTNDLIEAACHAIGREAPVTYEDGGAPCEALVGSPALMAAATGWQARKPVGRIVAEMISSLDAEGGNRHG